MKIPKQRTKIAVSDKGVEYIKVVDIRYPLLSYILSLPLIVFRTIRFDLQIAGILPIKLHKTEDTISSENNSNTVTSKEDNKERGIILGKTKEKWVRFKCTYKGKTVSGEYFVKPFLIDPNLEDGTDVLEFTWKLDNGNEITTYHMPDYFLRHMFSDHLALVGISENNASPDVVDDFLNHLLIRDSKALIDDRAYAKIRIDKNSHEVRLKYIGLEVSLASGKNSESCLNALLCGVIVEYDVIPPFILSFPLEFLIDTSSAYFDDVDEAWVSRDVGVYL